MNFFTLLLLKCVLISACPFEIWNFYVFSSNFESLIDCIRRGAGDVEGTREMVNLRMNSFTALIQAAKYGHSECVKSLIEAGAVIDCTDFIG